jgi:hypothetical protein
MDKILDPVVLLCCEKGTNIILLRDNNFSTNYNLFKKKTLLVWLTPFQELLNSKAQHRVQCCKTENPAVKQPDALNISMTHFRKLYLNLINIFKDKVFTN